MTGPGRVHPSALAGWQAIAAADRAVAAAGELDPIARAELWRAAHAAAARLAHLRALGVRPDPDPDADARRQGEL